MANVSIHYCGSFPPPFGGATKKNQALFSELSKRGEIDKIDFSLVKRRDVVEAFRFARALVSKGSAFVIGVSGASTRRQLIAFLYHANHRALERSVLMLMGGVASRQIADDREYAKMVTRLKKVYVETRGMKAELEAAGLDNVGIYPNGRMKPEAIVASRPSEGPIRCVYFAQVSQEKGVDIAIEAVEALSRRGEECRLDIYGKIPDRQRGFVESLLSRARNCTYEGVFQGSEHEIYQMLSGYDLLLFPSTHTTEGVPGTLVEAMVAGLPCVAFDLSYNGDIIKDGVTGALARGDCNGDSFSNALFSVCDRATLDRMSRAAKKEAENYYIEDYIDSIAKEIFE